MRGVEAKVVEEKEDGLHAAAEDIALQHTRTAIHTLQHTQKIPQPPLVFSSCVHLNK